MNPSASRNKIDAMIRRIVDQFHPSKIVLFGSYARGTANADSDADLLVIMPVEGSVRAKRIELRSAIHGLGLAKDVTILTSEQYESERRIPGTIARAAALEGKVLYERAA